MSITRLTVRVQPRASRDAVEGFSADGALRVRVTAPPVGGAANSAVCRVLAKALGIARSNVTVVQGGRGRIKVVELDGLSAAEIEARLAG